MKSTTLKTILIIICLVIMLSASAQEITTQQLRSGYLGGAVIGAAGIATTIFGATRHNGEKTFFVSSGVVMMATSISIVSITVYRENNWKISITDNGINIKLNF